LSAQINLYLHPGTIPNKMAAMSVQKCLFSLATLLGMLVLDYPAPVCAEPKVVKMAMSRSGNVNQRLARRNHVSVTVTNDVNEGLYFVNATVGTPPQPVQLQIDTGSSDIWFFGPNSCDTSSSPCLGGECQFVFFSLLVSVC
jgi:hypothetical protein